MIMRFLQAQLVDMRSDIHEVRGTKSILEKEVHNTLLALHKSQVEMQEKLGVHVTDAESVAIKKKLVGIHFLFIYFSIRFPFCTGGGIKGSSSCLSTREKARC